MKLLKHRNNRDVAIHIINSDNLNDTLATFYNINSAKMARCSPIHTMIGNHNQWVFHIVFRPKEYETIIINDQGERI